MSNLLLAVFCLFIGKALQNVRQFPESTAQSLNLYVIYVALPALILVQLPKISLNASVLAPVASAWLVMGFTAAVIWGLARYHQWSRELTGALLLVATLGNTSFIGIPLIEAHLGNDAIPYAILYDQLGTFLALNTFGIAVATYYSPITVAKPAPLWQKMLTFPPFPALFLGLALSFVTVPPWINEVLQKMAATLVPVVMVAVGMQWRLRIDPKELKFVVLAIAFLLIVKPTFALGLVHLMPIDPLIMRTIVVEAAMPAMISTSALALMYQLSPRLVATVIGYSLMLSFLTVWLWSLAV